MFPWRGRGATHVACVPSRLPGGPVTRRHSLNGERVPMAAGLAASQEILTNFAVSKITIGPGMTHWLIGLET
ncbi:MAG: hypothetical protein JWR80_7186 [Bradyrhizobium sp.]|nr:hypothetical protein [Bradyrhizobium sp.]